MSRLASRIGLVLGLCSPGAFASNVILTLQSTTTQAPVSSVFASQVSFPQLGSTVSTLVAPREVGGYRFKYWTIDGNPSDIAVCATGKCIDALGEALPSFSFVILRDVVLTAVYDDVTADVDADQIPDAEELRYFGNLAHGSADDSDLDQASFLDELFFDESPRIPDIAMAGGISRRGSGSQLVVLNPNLRLLDQASDPLGIVPTRTLTGLVGTTVVTDPAPDTSGTYRFVDWALDGTRQVGLFGANPTLNVVLNADHSAVADFVDSQADSDNDGIPDWFELRSIGALSASAASDQDGDGLSLIDEYFLGASPLVADLEFGGGISRLGSVLVGVPLMGQVSAQFRSNPLGIVPSSESFAQTGTVLQSPFAPQLAGQLAFAGWYVNDTRTPGALGVAVPQISVVAQSDFVGEARYLSLETDSDADGLPDWFELSNFGNTARTPDSNDDGDDFALSEELFFGFSPVIADSARTGGISRLGSPSALLDFRPYPRVREVLVGGVPDFFFANGTPEVNAAAVPPIADVPGSFTLPSNVSPAFGDWDGDGDLDLIVAGNSSAGGAGAAVVRVYRNGGSPVVVDFERESALESTLSSLVSGNANPSFALSDVNGDGRADLAIGGATGTVTVVASSGAFTAGSLSSLASIDTGLASAIPAFADVCNPSGLARPGDGFADLLVLRPDGGVRVYPHSGNLASPYSAGNFIDTLGGSAGVLPSVVPSAVSISAGDVNEDGLIDLAVSDQSGSISEFHRQSDGTFQLKSKIFGGTYTGFATRLSASLADLDGDGDADIIAGFAQGGMVYLRNQVEKLVIDPPARTSLVNAGFTLSPLTATGAVSWQVNAKLSRCGGAGQRACPSLDNAGHYVAGSTRGVVDVLEAIDDRGSGNKVLGRSYVNVIGPSDQTTSGKAIIIAGTKAADDVAAATNAVANKAYQTLLFRGFAKDNIRYLSFNPNQDVDGNGRYDDIAGIANFQSALAAFRDFAPGASQLTVVMVNHGQVVSGSTEFLLTATGERITPTDLKGWLDTLQNGAGHPDASLMLDFCYAGDFAAKLPFNPAIADRIVSTSTSASQKASLSLNGEVSFGGSYLSAAFQGFDLKTATALGGSTMAAFGQTAQLNDDGDSTPNNGDGARAQVTRIGPSHVVGQDIPVLEGISGGSNHLTQLTASVPRTTVWVDHVTSVYPIDRAWCTVIPPDIASAGTADAPIVSLTEVDLAYSKTNQRYEAEVGGFTRNGDFVLQCRVRDVWGSVSFPQATTVRQNSYDQRLLIVVGGPDDASVRFEAANALGNSAYRTALARGYARDHIRYLNPRSQDADGDGLANDITGSPSTIAFDNALTAANAANELGIVLIGAQSPALGTYQLASGDLLTGANLKTRLDSYQASDRPVTVIAEFGGAGAFIPQLAPSGCPLSCPSDPTQHKDRVVIATAQAGVDDLLASNGVLSGMQMLLSQWLKGDSLGRSLGLANATVKFVTGNVQSMRFDVSRADLIGKAGYTPGTPNDPALLAGDIERPTLSNRFYGPGYKAGISIPNVGRQLPRTVLSAGTPLAIWADNVTSPNQVQLPDGSTQSAQIVRVWAVVQPPSGGPLPDIDLSFQSSHNRWEGTYTATQIGTYRVVVYAMDQVGQVQGGRSARALLANANTRVSVPGTTQLDIGNGASVSFAAAGSNASEGGAIDSIVVTLSAAQGTTLTIPLILGGTAANAVDYALDVDGLASPAALTFAPGQTSKTIHIAALTDADTDPNETVLLSLGAPSDPGVALGGNNSHEAVIGDTTVAADVIFKNGFE